MLTTSLLSRSAGEVDPSTFAHTQRSRLLHALQPAPHVHFDGYSSWSPEDGAPKESHTFDRKEQEEQERILAHNAGVNAIAVDKFDGKFLLSGGADGGISLWDLEHEHRTRYDGVGDIIHTPLDSVVRSEDTHSYGVTALSWYPFDSLAFLSTSYDHTLKIYSASTLAPSGSFTLNSVIYTHAISPIASHLLVACGTQHPAIRLVDLRSGSAAQSLTGHGGAVLSVAWSPKDEFILASGSADGTVRFWDVRRSAGTLGVLDMDDSIGVAGYDGIGTGARRKERGKAHSGPVNGVVWTDDGKHVVTCGHDERIRVWNTFNGANTLANFGPVVRNRHLSTLNPCIVPTTVMGPGEKMLFYPNEKEILAYEMFEGKLLKRLRAPGVMQAGQRSDAGQRNLKNRVTAIAWKWHDIQLLSAHADGTIRSWLPRTSVDAIAEEAEAEETGLEDEDEERAKKRHRALGSFFY